MPGKTGVWVGERKIGAVGVRISQGTTSHGVALNVATDLSFFRHIVPCGTPDKEVTSLHRQLAGPQYERHLQQVGQASDGQQVEPPHAVLAAVGAAPPLTAPSLQQVADDFLDAFAAHFGYGRLEQVPDVVQLAAELGCSNGS